ncbi:hypothetical protein WG8_3967 [Paenibacillus sp. Aloe-11]|nr:hypothetical protein WG8_3967 [Paenibacillus sp. Aloe-11]
MAELNGVVRVDTGGNIVEYGGKSYAWMDVEPQAGDIVFVTRNLRSYLQTNGYYSVNVDDVR